MIVIISPLRNRNRRRYTGGFTPQGPIFFKCGVVDHKARNCTSQPHPYYSPNLDEKRPVIMILDLYQIPSNIFQLVSNVLEVLLSF